MCLNQARLPTRPRQRPASIDTSSALVEAGAATLRQLGWRPHNGKVSQNNYGGMRFLNQARLIYYTADGCREATCELPWHPTLNMILIWFFENRLFHNTTEVARRLSQNHDTIPHTQNRSGVLIQIPRAPQKSSPLHALMFFSAAMSSPVERVSTACP